MAGDTTQADDKIGGFRFVRTIHPGATSMVLEVVQDSTGKRFALKQLNPSLVVGSVNGFGITGPLKDDAGLDQVVQGMSGLMSITGTESGTYRVGVSIVDITSGMVCAFGIVSALVGRSTGHPVSHVSTSLLETALNLSVFQGQRALSLGTDPTPQGNNHPTIAPYGTFATATDPINIAVGSDKQWRSFCDLIGMREAADDVRFSNGSQRLANRDELTGLIEAVLVTAPAAEWVRVISGASIPCGPILQYTQAFASPQVEALALVHHGHRRDGSELPLLRGPLSMDGEASEIVSPPPLLGEHTAEVLGELGYAQDEIERLRSNNLIALNPA